MFRSRREAALNSAYAALLALDVTSAKRDELANSGVPQHTIDSLYPEAGFAALTPGLAEHFDHLPANRLVSASSELQRDVNTLMKVVPNHVWDIINSGLAFGQMADGVARKELAARVYALLDQNHFPINDARDWAAESIVTACWWAWWITLHPELVSEDMVQPATKLVLAVVKKLALNR